MLREIGLFIIIALFSTSAVLLYLPKINPFSTSCSMDWIRLEESWILVEGVIVTNDLKLDITIDAKMWFNIHGGNVSVEKVYIYIIPEEAYKKKYKLLKTLDKNEVKRTLESIAIKYAEMEREYLSSWQTEVSDIRLETPLVFTAFIEGDFKNCLNQSGTSSPVPPAIFFTPDFCVSVKAKANIGLAQLSRMLDIAVIGTIAFIIGDLKSENSWLRKLFSKLRILKSKQAQAE